MKHIIIGTAGHIDHGKTALIEALTGRNTDRLIEERQRGITIDLGFTWFDMKDGTRCGIIDVPGHEKFIGNMTAGVVGMDLVLMVVAADEGIMPQTIEHLDILELLGIRKTILVMNKCDLVDREWLEMIVEETKESLKGTILENAPAAKVSSLTGEGIEELKDMILGMVGNTVEERNVNGIPRLPVDRAFTMPGFGTVVTGTLLSGRISKGDNLEIYPAGKSCRVRSVQVHGENQETCFAGQRVALNLPGIRKEELFRGCVLAPKGSMKNTALIDVTLSILKNSSRTVRNRERFHLFTGTAEILCRAVLLDAEELKPGETGFAQLVCEEEIAVKRGDRFVVRFYSPPETTGGGVVLDSNPVKKKRFRQDVIGELTKKKNGSLMDVCELGIRSAPGGPVCSSCRPGDEKSMRSAPGGPVSLKELAGNTAHSAEELMPCLQELVQKGIILEFPQRRDRWYWHIDNALVMEQELTRALKMAAEKHPCRPGIPKAEIHSIFMKQVKPAIFDECLRHMAERGLFQIRDEYVCLADFEIRRDETFSEIEKLLTDTFENAGYHFLRFSEIAKMQYPDETVMDVLRVMTADGKAVRVSADAEIYTMKHFMDGAVERIREHFEKKELLTFTDVREMFGVSRKYAKLIIEYMDNIHVTRPTGAATERAACR